MLRYFGLDPSKNRTKEEVQQIIQAHKKYTHHTRTSKSLKIPQSTHPSLFTDLYFGQTASTSAFLYTKKGNGLVILNIEGKSVIL